MRKTKIICDICGKIMSEHDEIYSYFITVITDNNFRIVYDVHKLCWENKVKKLFITR